MLKVGLVGVGGISGAHIPAWESFEDVQLAALCDIRPEQMKKYPDKRRYTDFDEMLANEQLDIVDICLPTYLHADFAVKAMEKGIHVISEKPVSLKQEDIPRLYETARKNGVCFMVAQVLRFWPEYELIKELLENRKYGRLLSGTMTRLSAIPGWSWDGWMRDEARSGLVPYDLHIHDLDFLVYALGRPTGKQTRRIKRPEQDYLSCVYEFGDVFVNTEAAWYAGCLPFGAAYRFQFEKAVAVYEKGGCKIYEDSDRAIDLKNDAQGETGDIQLPKSNAYANELRYFADCVQKGAFPDKVKEEELSCVVEILNRL